MKSNLVLLANLLHDHAVSFFDTCGLNKKYSSSDEVFQRFIFGVLDGMVKTSVLEKASSKLHSFFSQRNMVKTHVIFVQQHGKAEGNRKFRQWIVDKLKLCGIYGLFKWDVIAQGIMDVTMLAETYKDLLTLYPKLLEKNNGSKESAMLELLSILEGFSGVSSKKALVLVRDLHYQCDWDYPIEKLPLPIDTHVRVTMKRMGFCPTESDVVIETAARIFFKVPVLTDLALWNIGLKYCEKRTPKCQDCVVSKYCEKRI